MAVGIVMMLSLDRFLQRHFQFSRLFQPLQQDRNRLQGPRFHQSCWAHLTRERVGVKIHQDRGSNVKIVRIPFLDCDTVGSEQTNQEEVRTTGETVYECKGKTNVALLQETPKQIPKRLFT